MDNPVIIKGNKNGLQIIIPPEATVDTVVTELKLKLQKSGHYYNKLRPITVTFDGKHLTNDEIAIILDTLDKIGIKINPNSPDTEHTSDNKANPSFSDCGLFYKGTLRNGQYIDALESIVIIGNVEQGARVTSTGNIIVIGELRGLAEAGSSGNENAFVYSLKSGRN